MAQTAAYGKLDRTWAQGEACFRPQERIGQPTMRNLDIDTRDTLRVYTETGLIGAGSGDGMPLLSAAAADDPKK